MASKAEGLDRRRLQMQATMAHEVCSCTRRHVDPERPCTLCRECPVCGLPIYWAMWKTHAARCGAEEAKA